MDRNKYFGNGSKSETQTSEKLFLVQSKTFWMGPKIIWTRHKFIAIYLETGVAPCISPNMDVEKSKPKSCEENKFGEGLIEGNDAKWLLLESAATPTGFQFNSGILLLLSATFRWW